jgi:GNAT superfamily N-acetyltransferase
MPDPVARRWGVRDATAADAAAIQRVAASAWRETYARLLRPETIEAFLGRAYSEARVLQRLLQDTVLVAEDTEGIGAFVHARTEGDRLHLAAFYADPGRRGQGAGTLLLSELRRRFPARAMTADVLVGNQLGEAFYERRGFEPRELLEENLFGETALERRWWLEPG